MTIADQVDRARAILESAGAPPADARRDATLLGRSLLGWDAGAWLIGQREPAPPDFAARLQALVARRAGHEPVAYIIGEREFFGRAFAVTPGALIPRPETEFVVEEALALRLAQPEAAIVDVGTGSGCLAVTIALEWPTARVIATDTSAAALDVARENARRWGVVDRIDFRLGPFLADAAGPVGLIVSNPPYVRDDERPSLPPEVVEFEPPGALFAGPEGLDVVGPLIATAARALAPDGWLVMEIGYGQADAVRRLIDRAGLALVRIRADLQGIPRVVVARGSEVFSTDLG